MKHKLFDVLAAFLLATLPVSAQLPVVKADQTLKTFGTMGKEAELFRHDGKGRLTHIRIYEDGENNASIDMELYLGHGIGFGDEFAPRGDHARKALAFLPISLYCWQGDDVGGFENFSGALGNGWFAEA